MSLFRVIIACVVAVSAVRLASSLCDYVEQCAKTKEVENTSAEIIAKAEQETADMMEAHDKAVAAIEERSKADAVRHAEVMAQLEVQRVAQAESHARQTAAIDKLIATKR